MPPQSYLPGREQTCRAVQEHHVPVGLRAGRHLRRGVRAEQPHRVDLRETAERGAHAEHDEEEAACLRAVRRIDPLAADRRFGLARAGELGVLLRDHECQMRADQCGEQAGNQQHMDDVEASDDLGAGELRSED